MRLRYFTLSSLLSVACLFSFTMLGAWLWADEFRKWTDATGKFTISAKLIEEKDGKVLLKKQDGSEITLPVERLSAKDQKYLASQNASGLEKSKSTSGQATDSKDVPRLREIAEKFYADLRSESRPVSAVNCRGEKLGQALAKLLP